MISNIFSFEVFTENSEKIKDPIQEQQIDQNKKRIFQTQSQIYDDHEIYVEIEILNNPNDAEKQLRIKTINETDNSFIPNVTYFLKILENDKILLSDFFYAEKEIFMVDVVSNNLNSIQILGERQYDHNAIIADNDNLIKISGLALENNVNYEFVIELRTLYDKSNWIFSLDNFRTEIILQ